VTLAQIHLPLLKTHSLPPCHSTIYRTMLHPLKRTTFVFVVLLTLILTYFPKPVSSLPIAIFYSRISHASNSSYIDYQLVFDLSFAFGTPRDRATTDIVFDLTSFPVLLIALAITCIWIAARMTIDRFISSVNREFSQSRILPLSPLSHRLSRTIGHFYRHSRTSSRPTVLLPFRHDL